MLRQNLTAIFRSRAKKQGLTEIKTSSQKFCHPAIVATSVTWRSLIDDLGTSNSFNPITSACIKSQDWRMHGWGYTVGAYGW